METADVALRDRIEKLERELLNISNLLERHHNVLRAICGHSVMSLGEAKLLLSDGAFSKRPNA